LILPWPVPSARKTPTDNLITLDGLANATTLNVRWKHWHVRANVDQTMIKRVITDYKPHSIPEEAGRADAQSTTGTTEPRERLSYLMRQKAASMPGTVVLSDLITATKDELNKNATLREKLAYEHKRAETLSASELRDVLGDLEEGRLEGSIRLAMQP
jgi:hypothetical protein